MSRSLDILLNATTTAWTKQWGNCGDGAPNVKVCELKKETGGNDAAAQRQTPAEPCLCDTVSLFSASSSDPLKRRAAS
jgi:hypothetical protein